MKDKSIYLNIPKMLENQANVMFFQTCDLIDMVIHIKARSISYWRKSCFLGRGHCVPGKWNQKKMRFLEVDPRFSTEVGLEKDQSSHVRSPEVDLKFST